MSPTFKVPPNPSLAGTRPHSPQPKARATLDPKLQAEMDKVEPHPHHGLKAHQIPKMMPTPEPTPMPTQDPFVVNGPPEPTPAPTPSPSPAPTPAPAPE